jgi:hypothetical protein
MAWMNVKVAAPVGVPVPVVPLFKFFRVSQCESDQHLGPDPGSSVWGLVSGVSDLTPAVDPVLAADESYCIRFHLPDSRPC